MKVIIFTVLLITVVVVYCPAQTCSPPQIIANAKTSNIFSSDQEMILGDLTLQRLAGEFRPIEDPRLLSFIELIGEKLIRHLPPTGLKFRFHIIEYPEANAFNIPGGHVFLSRKLIAFAGNEDEIASVIAHELGHATVHHGAVDMSTAMKKILNISTVGDRKDIIEKYNLLIENARTKNISQRSGHGDEKQIEADKIGFFSMVAAGYDPAATFTFFDRLTESKGKTGSWFSDLFGSIRPAEKRLREIAQSTSQLPQTCREGRSAKATEDFLKWQADVVMYRRSGKKEEVPGLVWKKELSPKLRSDVSRITFSPDGRLILVQDDFSITIIERAGLKLALQIPAEGVKRAYFTSDSNQVAFTTQNLRFERWDLGQKKAIEVRELVLRQDCWEHELSPDGNYLACVDTSTTVNVIETRTGKKVWEKKQFYPLSYFEYIVWLDSSSRDDENRISFFRIEFSPDSRFVMFSRSNKYRFRLSIDMMTVDGSENNALAVDMTTLKPVDIGGDMKKVSSRSYVFLDSERILGTSEAKLDAGGIFSFPGGKRLQRLEFGGEDIERTANSNYFTIKPLANTKLGIYDLQKNALVLAMDKNDIGTWNDLVAFESVSGNIVLRQVKFDESRKSLEGVAVGNLEIPSVSMTDMKAAEISDDFGWLAISSESRGGVWNLKTGNRTVFTRGFRSALVDGRGASIADFPKFMEDPHSLVLLDSTTGKAKPMRSLPPNGARQYGRFLLTRRSLNQKEAKKGEGKQSQFPLSEDEEAELKLKRDVSFELTDWIENKVIWTRDFKGVVPRFAFDSFSGRLIIYWRLGTEEGKARLKEDAALKSKADTLGNKEGDYLIDVVDAYQQKTIGNLLLETGKGSFAVGTGQSEADWLVLKDSEDRILAYSLRDNSLKHRFFGKKASINPTKNLIVVENLPGEIVLYSLSSGNRLANFVIDGALAFSRFSIDGNRLFLFSDSQAGYAIDLSKIKEPAKQIIF